MLYSKDYLTYDDFGLKEVRCMRCNTPIAIRDAVDVNGTKVMAMRRLSNWTYARVDLENGAYLNGLFCADCVAAGIDPEKTVEQVKKGWNHSLEWQRATPEERAAHVNFEKRIALKNKGPADLNSPEVKK